MKSTSRHFPIIMSLNRYIDDHDHLTDPLGQERSHRHHQGSGGTERILAMGHALS